MDTVFEYKTQIEKYINSLEDNIKIIISLEQLLYLLISNNPNNDEHLYDISKKLIKSFKNNQASANAGALKKLINYTKVSGLNESLNNSIYNLLLVDQVIIKNKEILNEEFNETLNNMNDNLIKSYNIEKQNFINTI